jgi:RimJ/RimL family protein N-acetyltransferase
MSGSRQISLVPLSRQFHVAALQQVYRATPGYWQMYELPMSPAGQAENDLKEAEQEAGRYMMGIVLPVAQAGDETGVDGAELIGLLDFRLHWPEDGTAFLGMFMVAEPYQRKGYGSRAWSLLEPWLAGTACMSRVCLNVSQFNHKAVRFFSHLGFSMTGEARRMKVGLKLVRRLTMEKVLEREMRQDDAATPDTDHR